VAIGTCDQASRGDLFNVLETAVGDGDVSLKVRWIWDLVSTKDTGSGCDGPLIDGTGPASNRWAVSYANLGPTTYYMHILGRKGLPRTLILNPSQSGTLTAQQCANNGYANIADFDDLQLTTIP
jgi:hypothetical protein